MMVRWVRSLGLSQRRRGISEPCVEACGPILRRAPRVILRSGQYFSAACWGYRWRGSLLASGWSTTGDRPAGSLPGIAVRLGEDSMSSQGARWCPNQS